MQDGGGVLFRNQPPNPPLLEAQDGGGRFLLQSTPYSLPARNANRGRGFSFNHPPYSLPLETQDQGGRFSFHYPSLARNTRWRAFLLQPPPLLPPLLETQVVWAISSSTTSLLTPCSKRKMEVEISLPTTPAPSLARNTRWTGFLFNHLPTPPLARNTRRKPPHSLSCLKRKTEGGTFLC